MLYTARRMSRRFFRDRRVSGVWCGIETVQLLCRTYGAWVVLVWYPPLTGWAILWRSYGAGLYSVALYWRYYGACWLRRVYFWDDGVDTGSDAGGGAVVWGGISADCDTAV